ncbi:MAG: cardiolipin synthase [Myxococcota bacterium]|jgi:cardiolipin synthase
MHISMTANALSAGLLGVLLLVLPTLGTLHVILNKEKTRAAVGWIGLLWLAPVVGAALYVILGINRIDRKMKRLGVTASRFAHRGQSSQEVRVGSKSGLARAISLICERPLRSGNQIRFLNNGDVAYPRMIAAFDSAEQSIGLQSYMIDNDTVGNEFVEALRRAQDRGVLVRVIVDGIGSLYSFPPISVRLRSAGLPFQRFLWSWVPWRMGLINLRNHRKLCVVDGRIAFTGGMNIRSSNRLADKPKWPVQDVHAEIQGPVVGDLMAVFNNDWAFSSGEELTGDAWWPSLEPVGTQTARALPAGPDADMEAVRWTFLVAIAEARSHLRIVTPYFLPDDDLLSALSAAALRGVTVDLFLPSDHNVGYLWLATQTELPALIRTGVRVWICPPPFAHTKLMVVDDDWVMFGSANWDARSLRLSFELNVESYDVALVHQAIRVIDRYSTGAQRLLKPGTEGSWTKTLLGRAVRLMQPFL